MRIDGSGMGMPVGQPPGRTAEPVPGEVVQGRVVASEGRQVTLRLTDGSTWQARLSEGVQLETGTVVRLEVGERVDGIPSARVMEQQAGNTGSTGNTMEAEMGEAFRALGTRVIPELVEKALLLMQESGMKSEQAAFLAANGLEGDTALRGLLDRMVGGSFGFADNWFDLASGLSTAVATMPEGERAVLSQSLVLFEAVDQLAQTLHAGQQGMTPTGEAGHVATSPAVPAEEMALLRQVLLSWAGQLPEPAAALRILQTLPGVLPETLFPMTGPAMVATSGTPEAGTGNPGEGAPLGGATGQELPVAEMGRTAAAGMMVENTTARNAVVPTEQAEVNTPVAMEGLVQMSLSTLSPQARDWLSQLFSQISTLSLQAREAPVPEVTQLQLQVLEAFEQAVLKVDAGQNPAQRSLDAETMAKLLGERLEWAATALESLTRETAAPLQPLLHDAVDAMRLFNQISTLHTFLEIPLRLNGEQAQGELYVMKRKGNRGRIDPSDFTLFLALDTMHIGHLETLAHARNNRVTLRFEVPDEGISDLVREMRKGLDDGLAEKGFQLVDMRVHVAAEKGVSPLNAVREAQHRLGLLGRVDVRL